MAAQYRTPVFQCVECSGDIPWNRIYKLYCCEFCKEKADYIRYHRKSIRNKKIKLSDVAEAIRIRRAHVLSGGYLESQRRLSKQTRNLVKKRDKEKCKVCGKPGTDIDHIKGPSNDISNLQLLCRACHNKKTLRSLKTVSIEDPEFEKMFPRIHELNESIDSKKPVRECHNELKWETRHKEIRQQRKAEFYQTIQPLIEKLKKNETPSKTSIAKSLNDAAIPTWSGRGAWNAHSVSQAMEK